jgi:TIR domain
MATLKELFDGEFAHTLRTHSEVSFSMGGNAFQATEQIYLSSDENACFLGYYVAEEFAATDFLQALLLQADESRARLTGGISVIASHPGIYQATGTTSATLPFTGRIILYVDAALDETSKQILVALGVSRDWQVQIRDRGYADYISKFERPLGFISHDSRDKDDLVRPLAERLRRALCPVWYDEFSMQPGASLRESIDAGLRDSKQCVVVLSPNFLTNPGWGKAEFNAIMNKHFAAGGNVLIPIWHGVTREQVAEYSPLVVDIFGINTNLGEDEVFNRVHRALVAN